MGPQGMPAASRRSTHDSALAWRSLWVMSPTSASRWVTRSALVAKRASSGIPPSSRTSHRTRNCASFPTAITISDGYGDGIWTPAKWARNVDAERAQPGVGGVWQISCRGIVYRMVDPAVARDMYTTFLASTFRSIRFGVNEAHGRGIAIQLNYLLDAGGVRVAADGRFSVDEPRFRDAVTALTRDLMTLQAEGSYEKANNLYTRMGVVRPEVQQVVDRLMEEGSIVVASGEGSEDDVVV